MMTWNIRAPVRHVLLALLALGIGAHAASAATTVTIKNDGPAAVRIGFDGGAPTTIAPRSTARFTLNDGDHSTQCIFEGYDGCNIAESFATEGNRPMNLMLRPVFSLEHAVAMAGQGTLLIETRDDVWATSALDVAGTPEECFNYDAGKMAAVSKRVAARLSLGNVTLANQNLCGRRQQVIGATVGGAQVYFHPRFVTFKEKNGRPVQVRQ